MKRVIVILFLALLGALPYAETAIRSDARAQGRRGASPAPTPKVDYSKFKHSSHAGDVKTKTPGVTKKLDCAYCHTIALDKPEVTIYPNGEPEKKSRHNACVECHTLFGPSARSSGADPAMCLICHTEESQAKNWKGVRAFPNPQVIESQFGDRFSHSDHTDFYDASKMKYECGACHDNTKQEFVGTVAFKVGVKESAPHHTGCFICHADEKKVPKSSTSYFAKCSACHAPKLKEKGTGSELATHWFARRIIDPEKNPFSHKDHDFLKKADKADASKVTQSCLACHATGKTAHRRSDFFDEDRKTKQKQPLVSACIACHDYDHKKEAQQKIESVEKLEKSSCLVCHSLKTIKDHAASGLPPANHLAPLPTPTPKS